MSCRLSAAGSASSLKASASPHCPLPVCHCSLPLLSLAPGSCVTLPALHVHPHGHTPGQLSADDKTEAQSPSWHGPGCCARAHVGAKGAGSVAQPGQPLPTRQKGPAGRRLSIPFSDLLSAFLTSLQGLCVCVTLAVPLSLDPSFPIWGQVGQTPGNPLS